MNNDILIDINKIITEQICPDCGNDAAMFLCFNEEANNVGIAFRGTKYGIEEMLVGAMNSNQEIKDAILGVVAFDFKNDVMKIINVTEKMQKNN